MIARQPYGAGAVRGRTRGQIFWTGAAFWAVVTSVAVLLRSGSDRPRVGDIRLLYYLAGARSVDAYLTGGGRWLLFGLHLVVAVVVGGAVTLLLWRFLSDRPRAELVVGTASAALAALFQALFFVPVG